MQLLDGNRVYSASDLVHFLSCRYHTDLDLVDLYTPLPKASADLEARLLREKGREHEETYLGRLKSNGHKIIEICTSGALADRTVATHAAMASGAEVIYQAVLSTDPWHGAADFLRRVENPSNLGAFSYEVIDTKLARSPTTRHVLQLCTYCDLLADSQGAMPHSMHLVLGDAREVSLRTRDFSHYYANAKRRFEAFCGAPLDGSYPEPCPYCDLCRWRHLCEKRWEEDDHLSLVANIRRTQIDRLEEAGITTVRALSEFPEGTRVPRMAEETLARLHAQARLQVRKRDTGEDRVEVLPLQDGRGFARMPKPDVGDLFFDIEGDPLYPDGLEYLFGISGVDGDHLSFTPIWGHNHAEEHRAFEVLMDSFAARLEDHPDAHIYHYNHYEPTALKRLASRYATREAILDDLLRRHKFVDLFKVVRQAIRVSEPNYTLKNLETFYMDKRAGDVTTAGQSIVTYERWRQSGDGNLLDEIVAYNRADCELTKRLRDWLITLRPKELPWGNGCILADEELPSEEMLQAEAQRQAYERRLLEAVPQAERPLRELLTQLLEFHRREAKPQWWAMFDRQDRHDDELIEDAECLGGLEAEPSRAPEPEKRSLVFTYHFPPQDYKFRVGDSCLVARTLEGAGKVVELDPDQCTVRIKRSATRDPLPAELSIIPTGPIGTQVLRNAIYRFADSILANDRGYSAIRDILTRTRPRLNGLTDGAVIIKDQADPVASAVDAVSRLRDSYLFIQGPPGAGKTFTSSHILVELIRSGHRVGVASNSHKAINNLLRAVEHRALQCGVRFRGVKKCTAGELDSFLDGEIIEDVTDNEDVDLSADLIAGTAWLFARPELNQALDYLLVDEAGQVSLANIVAMGLSARNIVLVGDQMQLGQPIQGVHPGELWPISTGVSSTRPGNDSAQPRNLPSDDLSDARGCMPLHL